jgi:stage II sporulation protein R
MSGKLIWLQRKLRLLHRKIYMPYRKDSEKAAVLKPNYWLLLLILVLSWAGSCIIRAQAVSDRKLQEGIAREIIRFHVIANSDSSEDQQLKLKVKEELVKELAPKLKHITDIATGRAVIEAELPYLKSLAQRIIKEHGYSYPVIVSLEPAYFPMKQYGSYTFPPGYYEALRVQIGEAKGQNWWCLMFPPLCFVDETYSIVDPEAEDQLKCILTEDEYEALKGKPLKVKYKFKLWDSFKKLIGG